MTSIATLSEAEIARRLAAAPPQGVYNPYPPGFFSAPPRAAAILIPFTCLQNAWHLLFIRRTRNQNDRHGGQVAFPGGSVDETDADIVSAALREAHEEVGLRPADVRILGQMNSFLSITNYLVTPVLGAFDWAYSLKLDPQEVSRAFTIPLAWLADPAHHQVVLRHNPPQPPWPVIYFDPFDGEALWGFTALIVLRVIELLSAPANPASQ